jgi:hypothetical protein
MGGPLVLNARKEILEGFADLRAGRLTECKSAPLLELPDPLLKSLDHESQRLVAELMGVAEARQRRHGAVVLSSSNLKPAPDDINDGSE